MTSKDEFLANFQMAARPISPTDHTGGLRLDPKHLESLLRRVPSWLTPRAVKSFDIKDFAELPPDAQRALESAVEQFQSVAKRAPRRPPAPAELVDQALPAFLTIFELVHPYLDEYAPYPILKQASLPDYVTDFAIKVGRDWDGDPSIWVWVIIKDEAADSDFSKRAAAIRELVPAVLEDAEIPRWPYIRFRTQSEQNEVEREELSSVP
jgi:hypothetical protein